MLRCLDGRSDGPPPRRDEGGAESAAPNKSSDMLECKMRWRDPLGVAGSLSFIGALTLAEEPSLMNLRCGLLGSQRILPPFASHLETAAFASFS